MNPRLWFLLVPIVPGLVWLWIFHRADRDEPEPSRLMLLTYLLGVVALVPAGIAERFLLDACGNVSSSNFGTTALSCFIAIGLSEELFKYLAVRAFIYRHREFNEPLDGIIYAAAAALGFASLENLIHVLDWSTLSIRWDVLGVRSILSLPGHVIFSATWGYALGRMKFGARRRAWPAMLAASFLHGLYDLLVFVPELRPFLGLYICIMVPLLIQQIRILRRDSPFAPAPASRRRAR